MKKSIFWSLLFSLSLVFFAVAGVSGAQGLVPCGLMGSNTFCDTCDLIVLVKNVLDFAWKGAWVLAAGMMVYGGFYMILPSLGGGAGMFEKGKKILWNVAKGLAIVFFAWVAIDTIIKVIADQNLVSGAPATINGWGPWNTIECTRAPKRAALPLLDVPEEFKCKPGQPSVIPGFDPCDPVVKQSLQDYWGGDKATSFAGPVVAGKCKPGILRPYHQQIQADAAANGVPLNCAQALFITESGGSSAAHSNKGAAGLGQIMPSTARTLEPQRFKGMSDGQIQAVLKSDSGLNIRMSMRYFGSIMHSSLGKNDCVLAAAGYNAGPDRLKPPRQGSSCKQQYIWQCIDETRDRMVPSVQGNLQQIASGCNPA